MGRLLRLGEEEAPTQSSKTSGGWASDPRSRNLWLADLLRELGSLTTVALVHAISKFVNLGLHFL